MEANTSTSTSQSTYASAIRKECLPSKDQAIILDAHEDISIKDYIMAVGKLINPSNIRYASRIANNRICIFLSSKLLVEKVVTEHPNINICDRSVSVRPLLTKAKRVILSNVCPVIPHDHIENELKKKGISLLSPISCIRAGFSDPGYSHILSFRRQIYIHPDDVDKLPENLQITLEDTNYWIFISLDKLSCFICKKEGHMAKQCPTVTSTTSQTDTTTTSNAIIETPNLVHGNTASLSQSVPENNNNEEYQAQNNHQESINSCNNKRPRSKTSTCDSVSLPANSNPNLILMKPPETNSTSAPRKKIRKAPETVSSAPADINNALSPVKDSLALHPDAYVLDYPQLSEFLSSARGNSDIPTLAKTFTTDLPAIIKMLRDIYPSLCDRSIKNRITRIQKKLQQYIDWQDDLSVSCDADSDKDSSDASDNVKMLTESPSVNTSLYYGPV